MSDPPKTERRDVVETLHTEEVRDPYRWLEADTEEVESWVERQNEYTDEHLQNDAREQLRPRMDARAEVPGYGVVTAREQGYFQRVEAPADDHAKLVFRTDLDGDQRVLADPNEWDGAKSLDWFSPSPDGSLLAYGVAEGGQEHYDVTILDVATGDTVEVIRDCGRTRPEGLAWADSGFYYVTTGSATDGGQLDKQLRYHELPDEFADDSTATDSGASDDLANSEAVEDPVLTDEIGEHVFPQLETGDGTLFVTFHEGWMHSEVFRWKQAGPNPADGELVRLVADTEASFRPRVNDGTVYLLTDYDAPHLRVVACDSDARNADPDDLREVVPQRKAILKDFVLAGDSLVVHRQHDAHSSLEIYDPEDGHRNDSKGNHRHGSEDNHRHDSEDNHRHDVDLPRYAAIDRDDLSGRPDAPEYFFRAQSFDRPPWVSLGDATTGEVTVVNERDGKADNTTEIVVEQHFFESADGTNVPAFVVHRGGIECDGDTPTVLYGYGGFRISQTPTYDRFRMPFLEDGGVYVHANLRGGVEYGEEWHLEGRRENKQNVFDDFYAVAEGLIDAGYTCPERLAAMGRSNGGLLVGAAVTQRPDLFGAVSCGVPLLDMLRFHKFLLGESWTVEYGSPEESNAFQYLRKYSPYHNVEERAYPAVLFETAAGDTRVHPSHARKMTARMQAKNTSDNPILLRTESEAGHGLGKPTSMVVAEQLDRWAFLYDQLGVSESPVHD